MLGARGPLGWGRRLLTLRWQLTHRGNRVTCVVCGLRQQEFAPSGVPLRQNALCPRCHSLERLRAMWLFLQRQTPFFEKPMRVLVIAPEGALERAGRRLHPHYLSGDLEPGFAMELMDLRATGLPDADRDLVIAYHVLEHIPEDRAAMKEMLRILRPDGMAVLEVPLRGDETDEQYMNASAEVRTQHYLQPDHVRWYGEKDFVRRLEDAGFTVERWAVGERFPAELTVNALDPGEVFFVARPA